MLEGAKGFTIIEVTIFLAISGLLLLAMFIGTGTMISRQRFTDSTDSLQVFFQSQYDEVVNGVNVSTTPTECGGSATVSGQSNCLLVGKLLTIPANSSTVSANYIIATATTTQIDTVQHELVGAHLKVVNTGASTYELKWGAQVVKTNRSSDTPRSGVNTNSVAFIRLPSSGRMVRLYYRNPDYSSLANLTTGLNGTGSTPGSGILDATAYDPTPDGTGSSFAVCVKNDKDFLSGTIRSAILFNGQGAGAITTTYQPSGDLGC